MAAVDRVVPDDEKELAPEIDIGLGERVRLLRPLQPFNEKNDGRVDDVVDALTPDEVGRHAARGVEVGDNAGPECGVPNCAKCQRAPGAIIE
jgi:hypothetical protein